MEEVPPQLEVFETLPDVVLAFDQSLTIRYVNPFARRLMNHEDTELDSQTLIEFVHPDDLGRAAEVAGLIAEDTLVAETTPAMYRARKRTGEYIDLEIQATTQFTEGPIAGMIVVIGRYNGDTILQDQILRMLSEGAPTDEIVNLLPEFGLWRHPEAQYAVVYRDAKGDTTAVGSDGALDLLERFQGPETPWNQVLSQGREVRQLFAELPDDLRAAAAELGMMDCMVLPVHERMHDELALAIGWSARAGQDVGAHRYALEKMTRALDIIMQWRSQVVGLEVAAQIDALSGVANRATFFRRFEDALRASTRPDEQVAVFYVDLDRFKQVNDTSGHALGDAVIVEAARRMTAAVRSTDLVARLGGDEFAVMCPGVTQVDEVTGMADRIVASIAEPFVHNGLVANIGASIGIAVAKSGDLDHEAVLAAADGALYDAKAAGRGRWHMA